MSKELAMVDPGRVHFRRVAVIAASVLMLLAEAGISNAAATGGSTSRVSVSSAGRQGNDSSDSSGQAISGQGRYVAFHSVASNLVVGDTNGSGDVFIRDRLAGVTRRVSVGPGGRQANEGSDTPAISADGRFVAFSSFASNLVAGDTNGAGDIFVRDVLAGVTRRVSVGSAGRPANAPSFSPAISADGLFVAFTSFASNLVPGDTNESGDTFVRDLLAGVTRRVSVGPGGRQSNGSSGDFPPSISANGRFVAFDSFASNLVPGDTGWGDVFVRDRLAGVTRRVSVNRAGGQADGPSDTPAISADGRFVAFVSFASDLVSGDTNATGDVFVRDLVAGVTRRASVGSHGQADNFSFSPAISGDGRFVAFSSDASNLVPGDTNATGDIFVRDRLAGGTRRASVGAAGQQANEFSIFPAISTDGRHVAFLSYASNLVPGDTNATGDVFVRDQYGDRALPPS
ncbi:MAG: hypothetical protein M3P18_22850 [Actinomycetota bacterium]|nr:hypothetical protein [Actinomycetota bacterium]